MAAAGAAAAMTYLLDMGLVLARSRRSSGHAAQSGSRGVTRDPRGGRPRRDGRAGELPACPLQRVVDRALPDSELERAVAVGAVVGRQRERAALEIGQRACALEDGSQALAAERLGDGIVIR